MNEIYIYFKKFHKNNNNKYFRFNMNLRNFMK